MRKTLIKIAVLILAAMSLYTRFEKGTDVPAGLCGRTSFGKQAMKYRGKK